MDQDEAKQAAEAQIKARKDRIAQELEPLLKSMATDASPADLHNIIMRLAGAAVNAGAGRTHGRIFAVSSVLFGAASDFYRSIVGRQAT